MGPQKNLLTLVATLGLFLPQHYLTLTTSPALQHGADEDGLELCDAIRQCARPIHSEVLADWVLGKGGSNGQI